MKTIRTKLFLFFLLFMVSFVLCGILLNVLFLERYYIYKSKDIFIATSQRISEEYAKNKKGFADFINEIERVEGINSIITDKNHSVKYNSIFQKTEAVGIRLPSEIGQLVRQNERNLLKSYVYTGIEKGNDQVPKLVFISRLNSGELIILRKPMKGISESASIANQFFLFAGLMIIILGGILIFVFSKKITRPIIEMSNVAESISNLEFNKRVTSDSQDEVGTLGRSINKISEKLSESIYALKKDVERRKQLVRNLSHELKTPIGVIKGYAEGLKFGVVEDKEKTQKYCTVISEECDRMDKMVRELLNLSMLESGMFEMKVSQFDIKDLIHTVTNRFETALSEKGIILELDDQKNLAVSADFELLERVMINYIVNAINHAEGTKQIKVKTEEIANRIRISVYNTGKHIPNSEMESIWDVFYKGDKARSRIYGGHGLGLSIVKLIADLHGGAAGVENVNEGVLFFVEIPKEEK